MKLTLAETKYLKESIGMISELVNETRIKATKDGLELVAMDPANVAMIVFKLLASSFAEYSVPKDADIAINLNNLRQILRRVGPSDVLTLELGDGKLKVQLKAKATRTFSLPIIDLEDREQKVPALSFPVRVETAAANLSEAIEDADIVSDAVSFAVEPGKLSLQAEGDLNSAAIEIPEGKDTKIEAKESVRAKYSVEYLKKMMGGSKLADNVVVEFNKDYPLRLTYNTVDKVNLSFILAPRVENE